MLNARCHSCGEGARQAPSAAAGDRQRAPVHPCFPQLLFDHCAERTCFGSSVSRPKTPSTLATTMGHLDKVVVVASALMLLTLPPIRGECFI